MSDEAQLLRTEASPFTRCLGVEGLSLHSLHHQIVTIIERELGPRHARLYAKPLEGQNARDWYAYCTGICTLASSLPDKDRRLLFQETESLWLEIAELAKSSTLLNERQRKAIAMARPPLTADRLYLCDDQPVSIGWGLEIEDDPLPESNDILRIKLPAAHEDTKATQTSSERQTVDDVSPAKPVNAGHTRGGGQRRFWPSLLLIILVFGLVFWWLCRAGLLPFVSCAPNTRPAIVNLEEKPLDIMAGKWKVSEKTPLRDTQTNVRLHIEYSFDQSGRGSRLIRQEGGGECTGPSHIKWADEKRIRVYSESATCNIGNKNYLPEVIFCQPSAINKPAVCVQRDDKADDKVILVPVLDN